MKVAKEATGYVCDFCGRWCANHSTSIALPVKRSPYPSYGEYTYIPERQCLCPRCAKRLYILKDIIKDFCKSPLDPDVTFTAQCAIITPNEPHIAEYQTELKYYK